MQKRPKSSKKLNLTTQSVRVLVPKDLREIAGGAPPPTLRSCSCDFWC